MDRAKEQEKNIKSVDFRNADVLPFQVAVVAKGIRHILQSIMVSIMICSAVQAQPEKSCKHILDSLPVSSIADINIRHVMIFLNKPCYDALRTTYVNQGWEIAGIMTTDGSGWIKRNDPFEGALFNRQIIFGFPCNTNQKREAWRALFRLSKCYVAQHIYYDLDGQLKAFEIRNENHRNFLRCLYPFNS